jgi:glycosyltransferase involved in cell wall biosynthesis
MRKLRALWLTNMIPSPRFGFRGNFVSQQLEALRQLGDVEIDLELIAQDNGKLDYLLANARVNRRWKQGHYDLVHVHYGLTGLAALCLPSRAPLVFTFYGSDINLVGPRLVSRWVARRARRRIFVSRRLGEHWPSDRNLVLPNGIDFEHCRPGDRNAACRALGLDPARKWVLFGSFPDNPVKGYRLFAEVLARVQSRHPEAGALILSEQGQDHDAVVGKLNAADVLLFTSQRGQEGSPTVIKESLVVGLPVVSVDVGDVREMLDGVSPGSVIDWPAPGDRREAWVECLADEVVRVLESGRRTNGRDLRAFLSQDIIARRTVEAYRDALA